MKHLEDACVSPTGRRRIQARTLPDTDRNLPDAPEDPPARTARLPTALLRYWSLCIADAAAVLPPAQTHESSQFIRYEQLGLKTGAILEAILRQIASNLVASYAESVRHTGERPKTAPVLLAPLRLTSAVERGVPQTGRAAIPPLLLPARLTEDGNLLPTERRPWLNRLALEPSLAAYPLTIGDSADADNFVARHPDGLGDWTAVARFGRALFRAVSGCDLGDEDGLRISRDLIAANGYLTLDSSVSPLIANLKRCLDRAASEPEAVSETSLNALLNLGERHPAGGVATSPAHLGHISPTLALTASQRIASVEAERLADGAILAIKGPPGTGKTALLQSIAASTIVRAALDGKPAMIIAASNNNQAITNLRDAFDEAARADADDLLGRRWIGCASYALYLPSAGRAKDLSGPYAVEARGTWSGWLADQEHDQGAAAAATTTYLANAASIFKFDGNDVATIRDALHADLETLHQLFDAFNQAIVEGDRLWPAVQHDDSPAIRVKAQEQLVDNAQQAHGLAVDALRTAEEAIAQGRAKARELRRIALAAWLPQSLVEVVLSFLSAVRKRRLLRAEFALEDWERGLGELLSGIAPREIAIRQAIDAMVARADAATVEPRLQSEERRTKSILAEALAILEQYQETERRWCATMEQAKKAIADAGGICRSMTAESRERAGDLEQALATDRKETIAAALERTADIFFRRRLFHLAMRFHEAQWIISIQQVAEEPSRTGQGEKFKRQLFARYALAMPVFVATFHQIGRHFSHQEFKGRTRAGKTYDTCAMYGIADLLLIDEAGQCSPDIAAIAFLVSRRAIAVGDRLQIPPVVALPQEIELANAETSGIFGALDDIETAGLRVVGGSIMSAAQAAGAAYEDPEGGILLREHFRCDDRIIAYCNQQFYRGRLLPRRGRSSQTLPAMAWGHVPGEMERGNAGNANLAEAHAIARWIRDHSREWRERYGGRPLREIVAAVTPFRAQAAALRNALAAAGLAEEGITAGTVHALQGAQRPIIVFAPTYSRDTRPGRLFFDLEPSILNVAVSRAQDCFAMIGDMGVFLPDGPTPSDRLAGLLLAQPDAELTDVDLSGVLSSDADAPGIIETIEDHRETLAEAFREARHRLLIVSPWLTPGAMDADGVDALVRSAVARGVDVRIVTSIHASDAGSEQNRLLATRRLEAAGSVVIARKDRPVHDKIIVHDANFAAIGSFNWLSAARKPTSGPLRRDRSYLLRGDDAAECAERFWQAENIVPGL